MMQHRYVKMMPYLMSSKIPFTDSWTFNKSFPEGKA